MDQPCSKQCVGNQTDSETKSGFLDRTTEPFSACVSQQSLSSSSIPRQRRGLLGRQPVGNPNPTSESWARDCDLSALCRRVCAFFLAADVSWVTSCSARGKRGRCRFSSGRPLEPRRFEKDSPPTTPATVTFLSEQDGPDPIPTPRSTTVQDNHTEPPVDEQHETQSNRKPMSQRTFFEIKSAISHGSQR